MNMPGNAPPHGLRRRPWGVAPRTCPLGASDRNTPTPTITTRRLGAERVRQRRPAPRCSATPTRSEFRRCSSSLSANSRRAERAASSPAQAGRHMGRQAGRHLARIARAHHFVCMWRMHIVCTAHARHTHGTRTAHAARSALTRGRSLQARGVAAPTPHGVAASPCYRSPRPPA